MSRFTCFVAVIVSTLTVSRSADADLIEFVANIDGFQPASCAGTGSAATGVGSFMLDTDTGVVTYDINYAGLGSAEQAAHVHGPAPVCEFAGIVYILPSGTPKIGTASLSPQQQLETLMGRHFVLIHSADIPAGEIRGQVLPVFSPNPFLRGDCSGDGATDLGDAISLLDAIFVGGNPILCADACDMNDDGQNDLGDAIYLLSNLFAGGASLAEPLTCGADPTVDGLDCLLPTCP